MLTLTHLSYSDFPCLPVVMCVSVFVYFCKILSHSRFLRMPPQYTEYTDSIQNSSSTIRISQISFLQLYLFLAHSPSLVLNLVIYTLFSISIILTFQNYINEIVPFESTFFPTQHALGTHPSCCLHHLFLWYVCTMICLTTDPVKDIQIVCSYLAIKEKHSMNIYAQVFITPVISQDL